MVNPKNVLIVVLGLAVLGLIVAIATEEPVGAISEKWAMSTHADAGSESFTHWDEDEPPVIPPGCATCHSTYGFHDFLGFDGTPAGSVEAPAETGSVIFCSACHNPSAEAMNSVVFPSGVLVTDLGPEAVCMQCHQGRRSTVDVREAVEGLEPDAVSEELSFINVHYQIAAATQMGGVTLGAYQYDGQTYAGRFEHAPDLQSCVDCHDPHSQRVPVQSCSPCHVNVVGFTDLRAIRTSDEDYDGDGDVEEGAAAEIETLHQALYIALQDYARSVIGTPILYANSFPYFFVDSDGDGAAGPDETSFDNAYSTWTPRLLKAAYNYHFVYQDPGAYTHNPYYVLQFLYDSLADLSEQVPVVLEDVVRPAR